MLLVKFRTKNTSVAKAAFDTWMEDCGLSGHSVYKLSDYEGKDLGRGGGGHNPARIKKTMKKVFRLKALAFKPNLRAASDNYDSHAADLEGGKGVWMEIHKFRPVGSTNQVLATKLRELEAIGVDLNQQVIIGVKPGEKDKIGTGWQSFNDFYVERIERFIKGYKNVKHYLVPTGCDTGSASRWSIQTTETVQNL